MSKRKPTYKHVQPASPLREAVSPIKGAQSMTNWMVLLVVILPVLTSWSTLDSTFTIRYLFLGGFVCFYVFFFYINQKQKVNLAFPKIVLLFFGLNVGFAMWG